MAKEKTDKEVAQEELEIAKQLAATASTPGGKLLVGGLISDVVGQVNRLMNGYQTLPHTEMMAICADMKTKLDLARALTRAEENKLYLDEMLADSLKT